MKNLEKYWLVLVNCYFKLPALVRYCIAIIQTNPNNHCLNTNLRLTGDPPECFYIYHKRK